MDSRIIGIIDNKKYAEDIYLNVKLFFLETGCSLKKIKQSLILAGLDISILNKNYFELSSSEQTKIRIAKALLSKEVHLINPTKNIDSKSKQNLVKIIKLMKLRYNKSVVITSRDTDFLHQVADYIIVMIGDNIVTEGPKYKIFTDEELLKKYKIKMPTIIYFSKLVQKKKNINIGFRDDINDLMKDIYRYVRKGE